MSDRFGKIAVIGLGYIGLPTAATFASKRVEVVGVDVSPEVVAIVNSGDIHIVEPELDILVRGSVSAGHLRCSLIPEAADAFLLTVPTPLSEDNSPNIDYIKEAAKGIAPVLEQGNLIVLESTSPVGTTLQLSTWLAELRPDLKFPHEFNDDCDVNIAYCPERVLPGHILHELIHNDRVIGGISKSCSNQAKELYQIVVRGDLLLTDSNTAEMSKLTENAFRDVNIAFANELSMICSEKCINVWQLIELANRHPRVNILQPGPGVGGHCIAVDPWFLVHSSPENARLIRTAREVNDEKISYVFERIKEKAERFKAPVIACLGLAFKPDIDDLRESPALKVVKKLASAGVAKIKAVEPNISKLPAGCEGVELCHFESALEDADIVVVLVKHSHFSNIEAGLLDSKILFDFVNAFCR
jgi:UDP-N-acetyl-D-mannosaminuronic acid dehydrogenase